MTRAIVHIDLDAFYASVEELLRPELRGRPVIIGGDPTTRGVVASASYAARSYGVRSAQPLVVARRLCPDAIFLPVRHDMYREHSRRIMSILRETSPLIEQTSIDEAFVELSGVVWERAVEEARGLQRNIVERTGLSASAGVATSKLVAKVASDEHKPAGFTVIPPGNEASFLAPLSVERLWGVGPKTAERLHALGLRSIGDVAAAPRDVLTRAFGHSGADLQQRAWGRDGSPVETKRQTRSISAEHTFARDTGDRGEVEQRLRLLADDVSSSLRRQRLSGRTVTLKLRYRTFETVTRSSTVLLPTGRQEQITSVAIQLLRQTWTGQTAVRLVGIGIQNLVKGDIVQPSLFSEPDPPDAKVASAVDRIRQRFGRAAIQRGSLQ